MNPSEEERKIGEPSKEAVDYVVGEVVKDALKPVRHVDDGPPGGSMLKGMYDALPEDKKLEFMYHLHQAIL